MSENNGVPVSGSGGPASVDNSANPTLLEVKVGAITVDITQAFVNIVTVIAGTVLVATGHMDANNLQTWVGGILALLSGAAHIKTLHGSNADTKTFADQMLKLIGILKHHKQ